MQITREVPMYGIRLMLITRSRQILALAGWLLLLAGVINFHVGEFILTFCLGGFIPGTGVEVTPLESMYVSCIAVLVIGYLSILHVRAAQARRNRYYSMRQPVVTQKSRIFAAQVAPKDAKDSARSRQISAFLPSLRRHISDSAVFCAALVVRGSLLAVLGFAQVCIGLVDAIIAAGRWTRLSGIHMNHKAGQAFSDLWQGIDPVLNAIDAWLEIQFRAGESWTARKLSQSEPIQTFRTIVDDWTARPVEIAETKASRK
jgi:hypothetical protein